jgi:hypothetical protein
VATQRFSAPQQDDDEFEGPSVEELEALEELNLEEAEPTGTVASIREAQLDPLVRKVWTTTPHGEIPHAHASPDYNRWIHF